MKTLILISLFILSNLTGIANAQKVSDYDLNDVSSKVIQYADAGSLTKIGTALGPHVACLNIGRISGLLDSVRSAGKWSDELNAQVRKLLNSSEKLNDACLHLSPYATLTTQISEVYKDASTLFDMTKDAKKVDPLQACEAKLQIAKDELTNLGSSKVFTSAQKSGISRVITAISDENKKAQTTLPAKQ